MIYEDSRFHLPNLYTLQNGNTFYGSYCGLRFRVAPAPEKGEDGEIGGTVTPLVWYGERCLEESEAVAEATFPLNAEGYQQVLDWLDGEYERMKSTEQHLNATGV
jgi:hypothetical protein